jgi:hypothetical protein
MIFSVHHDEKVFTEMKKKQRLDKASKFDKKSVIKK